MGILLFLLFAVLPIAEIYLLLEVYSQVGFMQTFGLVILTALAGAYFTKSQGGEILKSMNHSMQQGQVPAAMAIRSLLTIVGGILLFTPGFITDLLGLSFILPMTQWFWLLIGAGLFKRLIQSGNLKVMNFGQPAGFGVNQWSSKSSGEKAPNMNSKPHIGHNDSGNDVIDVDFSKE